MWRGRGRAAAHVGSPPGRPAALGRHSPCPCPAAPWLPQPLLRLRFWGLFVLFFFSFASAFFVSFFFFECTNFFLVPWELWAKERRVEAGLGSSPLCSAPPGHPGVYSVFLLSLLSLVLRSPVRQ